MQTGTIDWRLRQQPQGRTTSKATSNALSSKGVPSILLDSVSGLTRSPLPSSKLPFMSSHEALLCILPFKDSGGVSRRCSSSMKLMTFSSSALSTSTWSKVMMHLMCSRLTTSAFSLQRMAEGNESASWGSNSRRSRSCSSQGLMSRLISHINLTATQMCFLHNSVISMTVLAWTPSWWVRACLSA